MKRIISYLLIAVSLFGLQSCLFEQKDLFEESASTRLSNVLNDAQKVLTSSEYGWLMELYPAGDQSWGGYAFALKFDEQEVEVFTELADDPATSVKSYYKMGTNNGPMLSFDTYNTFLHFFATPSSSRYQAYGGEFEFVFSEITNDLIKLRGTRTGNTMYLRKLTEPAPDYISKVMALNENLIMSELAGTIGSGQVSVVFDSDYRQLSFVEDGKEETTDVAFAVTETGLRLYDTVEVCGQKFNEMTLSEDGMSFTCNGISSELKAKFPEGWRPYSAYEGKYILHYEQSATDLRDVEVTLTPAGDGSTYIMSGLNDNYTVVINYKKTSGSLVWYAQQVGVADSNVVWLCAWSVDGGGTLTWSTSAGVKTVWNGDEEHPVYTLTDNGESNYSIDSFILWQLTSSLSSVGEYSQTAWRIKGSTSTRLRYVRTLTKID